MNLVTIGSVTLPARLVAAAAALFIAPLLLKLTTKTKTEDWYWNSFITFFMTAKLSYVLFDWKLFIKSPFSLLYFDGGKKGLVLASVAVFIYFLLQQKKGGLKSAGELFHLFFIAYLSCFAIFAGSIGEAAIYLVLMAGTAILLYRKKQLNVQAFILLFLAEILGLSIMKELWEPGNLAVLAAGIFTAFLSYFKKGDVPSE